MTDNKEYSLDNNTDSAKKQAADRNMSPEQLEQYYILLDRFADQTTRPDFFDRSALVNTLTDICHLFRISKGVTEFYLTKNDEAAGNGEVLVDYNDGHGDVLALKRRIESKNGAIIIESLYMAKDALPLSDAEYTRLDVMVRMLLSFIARNRLQDTVHHLAFYDSEGYPNDRSYQHYIMQKIHETGIIGMYCICYNLSHFTLINETYSRPVGDVIMKNHFLKIKEAIGEHGMLCRLGGDNFCAIFDPSVAPTIFELLRETRISTGKNSDEVAKINARVGVFQVTEDAHIVHYGQIMERIYFAAQTAKLSNIPHLDYSEEMHARREGIMHLRERFQKALINHEFQAYYQPKVDIDSGQIIGAEALCRWFSDGKMVMPMEFIPILEQSMDICRLDFHILELVCRDIRQWLDEGMRVVKISVNLSRKHLVDPDLLQHILEPVERYQIPHEYLEIELTETTTDVEFKDLKRVVKGLQDVGIYTSVDDFGDGYSSLNLIRVIPWNVLKIDRSLLPMEGAPTEDVTSQMYRHIVSMAKSIGLPCVTEGVETEKQVNILRENHCRYAQGFIYDRPLPREEFERRLSGEPYPVYR